MMAVKQTRVLTAAVNIAKLNQVLIDACCTQLSLVNSGVTGQMFTKLLSDVQGSSPLLMWPSALQSSNPFWNASTTNEGQKASFRQ